MHWLDNRALNTYIGLTYHFSLGISAFDAALQAHSLSSKCVV